MAIKLKLPFFIIIFAISNIFATGTEDQIATAIDGKNWSLAQNLLHGVKHKSALTKLVISQKFLDSSCQDNNFEEMISFVKQNPNWPQISRIKLEAEKYLSDKTEKKLIVDWFAKNKPQTPNGYKYYALAISNPVKEQEKIIKEGWIYSDFTESQQKFYLDNFGKFLTEHDHFERIEEQLWRLDVAEAARTAPLVNLKYRKNFAAQVALIKKEPNAHKLLHMLPKQYYSSGLLYHYLESQKKDKHLTHITELFRLGKKFDNHHEAWTKLQLYYVREFIWHKNFNVAYRLLSIPFAQTTIDKMEVQWLSGWIALNFLKKPSLALAHFEQFKQFAKRPISMARALYWLGRTYEALGKKSEALRLYNEASAYSYCFYGQISLLELKKDKIILPTKPKIEEKHKISAENKDIVKCIKFLFEHDNVALANNYLEHAIGLMDKSESLHMINILNKHNKNINHRTNIGKVALWNDIFIQELAFPTPFKIKHKHVSAELAYAIMRQESVFDQYAISKANATGLMQLIEATACATAKQLNIKCNVKKLVTNPDYNILLGTYHLKQLLKEYQNSYILTMASYNTDPKNVKIWLNIFGDPRRMKNVRDVINWIELIPFHETRNYVQRVLENMQVYSIIINKNNKLFIKNYLL